MYERKKFKDCLEDEQLEKLENYFYGKTKKPTRQEKITMSIDIRISPILLNRWFQAKRNKEKYVKKHF